MWTGLKTSVVHNSLACIYGSEVGRDGAVTVQGRLTAAYQYRYYLTVLLWQLSILHSSSQSLSTDAFHSIESNADSTFHRFRTTVLPWTLIISSRFSLSFVERMNGGPVDWCVSLFYWRRSMLLLRMDENLDESEQAGSNICGIPGALTSGNRSTPKISHIN